MRRALVLGGGGVVGIAWEAGLLAGLAESGIDHTLAECLIGTSAGSIVGTRLAAGLPLQPPADGATTSARAAASPTLDRPVARDIFQRWSTAAEVTPALTRAISQLACRARPLMDEAAFIAMTTAGLPVDAWPERRLRITAVEVESGARVVFDRTSGVPLERAIGASCAVPGFFPPITIAGKRYVDGGVHSGTNADLAGAEGADVVLVLAAVCEGTASFGALAARCLAAETATLRAGGVHVIVLTPGPDERAAFGPDLLDPRCARAAFDAGQRRGRASATEAAGWRG